MTAILHLMDLGWAASGAFLKVFNMSITGGYVILAILVLRLLLRRAPKKYAYALWSVAAFRLVCPVSFEAAFSLFRLRFFDMRTAQQTGGAALQYVPQDIGYTAQPRVTVGIPAANAVISDALPAAMPQASVNPMQLWLALAALLWLAGLAALLIWAAVSYVRLCRRMRTAVRREGNVYESDRVCSPFILGFLRPRIYLPFGLDEDTLRYVLTHERYHLRQRDHLVKPFAFVMLAVHWFNPLCWLAFCLMGRDMEMRCDEWVIAQEGGGRKAYSLSLLSFAANRRFPAPGPLAFGETGVKGRIRNVLRWKQPRLWVTIIAAALCVAAVAACAANPARDDVEAPFGKTFHTDAVAYEAPQFSSVFPIAEGWDFRVGNDGQLDLLEDLQSDQWLHIGVLEEIKLTADNFDAWFAHNGTGGWAEPTDPAALRRDNRKAWRAILPGTEPDTCCYLLQQKDGDIYLAYGHYDPEGEESYFRWLLTLRETDAPIGQAAESLDADLRTDTAYVTYDCYYMNPLSSFAAFGGDGGCLYTFSNGEFRITDHETGEILQQTPMEGAGWQDFPYTETEWAALFTPIGVETVDISGYSERHFWPLSDEYSLLRMDDELWLLKLNTGGAQADYVWSIYVLVPQTAMGEVLWDYRPTMSHALPALPVSFEVPYLEASIYAQEGHFVDNTGEDLGQNSAVEPGQTVYWSPVRADGTAVSNTKLSFAAQRMQGGLMNSVYAGGIYLEGTPQDGGMRYRITVAGTGLRIEQDEETDGVRIIDAAASEDLLDEAVSNAVLAHGLSEQRFNDPAFESHVTLAAVTGRRWDETADTAVETATVYAMALFQELEVTQDSITDIGGSHMPVVLSFDRNVTGAYELTNYWTPRDGSYYVPDVEKAFSAVSQQTVRDALDTQKHIVRQEQACWAQAVEWYGVDTDTAVARLFDTIEGEPAASSRPADYLEAHPNEYHALLYYGDYTLRYVFGEFLKGGQTGLRGQLMRCVMQELLGDEAPDTPAATGQDYFDAWRAAATQKAAGKDREALRESAPGTALLLELLEK